MHELGIAQSIVDIVGQHVPGEQMSAVRSVKVRIGALSGVVADSLEFSFLAIIADTPLECCRLDIEKVPTISECAGCHQTFETQEFVFMCPSCNGASLKVVSGSEMQVVSIELEDHGE